MKNLIVIQVIYNGYGLVNPSENLWVEEDIVITDGYTYYNPATLEPIYQDEFTRELRKPDQEDLNEFYYSKELLLPNQELDSLILE